MRRRCSWNLRLDQKVWYIQFSVYLDESVEIITSAHITGTQTQQSSFQPEEVWQSKDNSTGVGGRERRKEDEKEGGEKVHQRNFETVSDLLRWRGHI